MGRRKIEIKLIEDKSTRRTTFKKRKQGLIKKAMELSILTNADVHVLVFNEDELHEYGSMDPRNMIRKYVKLASKAHERYDNSDYSLISGNQQKAPKASLLSSDTMKLMGGEPRDMDNQQQETPENRPVQPSPQQQIQKARAARLYHRISKQTASPPILQYKQKRKLLASPNPKFSPMQEPQNLPHGHSFLPAQTPVLSNPSANVTHQSNPISVVQSPQVNFRLQSPREPIGAPSDLMQFSLLTPKDFENGLSTPRDLMSNLPSTAGNVTPNLERIMNL